MYAEILSAAFLIGSETTPEPPHSLDFKNIPIQLLPEGFTQKQLDSHYRDVSKISKEIIFQIGKLKEQQTIDLPKVKVDAETSERALNLTEVRQLRALVNDQALSEAINDFSKFLKEISKKHNDEVNEINNRNRSIAAFVFTSRIQSGVGDHGTNYISVPIENSNFEALQKLNKNILPQLNTLKKAFNIHICKVEFAKLTALNATNSITVPISLRAIEIRDLTAINGILLEILIAYKHIYPYA